MTTASERAEIDFLQRVVDQMASSAPAAAITQQRDTASSLTEDDLRRLYQLMALAKACDEKAWTLHRQGRISFVAPCRGHEAAQVGSAYALRPGHDVVFTYYRDIAVGLTLGMDLPNMFLSLFGKEALINGGSRHMPWHLCHTELKLMPATSVVATQIPQAAGAALAAKYRHEDAVTIVYFGDGATSEGDFHEALNWAAIHRLPLVFLCENNGYAISTPVSRQMSVTSVADRAAGYGVPGHIVDGSDPLAVYQATAEAVARARQGGGPTLLDAHMRRLRAHTSDDDNRRYMSPEQIEELRKHDPVDEYRQKLLRKGVLSPEAAQHLDDTIRRDIDQAVEMAEAAPEPDVHSLATEVFGVAAGQLPPASF
ncbi:MAG: thiamine pyrophosphate-dependent dehydrogenase E1 component subunit alpha [Chloroflexota bacterium]